ncbi:RnfH family protein [Aquabacterium sp. J223]|uniref:RnfH family protein n=1 Tax=Aquabacterium sp. J223 TaxID=2898431 RepID=UPI0021AD7666|nr:RnfH family protein [Aquabacterium sp. J223]UUX93976.1 RnfH family protein [Aquabacterium sp. J223]
MVGDTALRIEAVFCPADGEAVVRTLQLPAGATVGDALQAAGLAGVLGRDAVAVGVWGRPCASDHRLNDGDRVELYRPLQVDPMEARRARQKRQAAGKGRPPRKGGPAATG